MTSAHLVLGDVTVEVIKKDIKNLHLSVHPPTGAVRIAAPRRMKLDAIRLFAISKLPWIRQHQRKLRAQEREPQQELIDRESHYVWGKRYLLKLIPNAGSPKVVLRHRTLELHCRADLPADRRAKVLDHWYRKQIRSALPAIHAKWQRALNTAASRFFVQRMKTKWGSSNPERRNIRLNTELARKPQECLEYIVLHEMAHFMCRRHDQHFVSLLDRHMPHWRSIRDDLNSFPLPHEEWR